MPGCIVKGCHSGRRKSEADLTMHCFPRQKETVWKWLKILGQDSDFGESMVSRIADDRKSLFRICSKHFPVDSYEKRGTRWFLKKEAMPSLYLNLEEKVEHPYCKKRKRDEDELVIEPSHTNLKTVRSTSASSSSVFAVAGEAVTPCEHNVAQKNQEVHVEFYDVQLVEEVESAASVNTLGIKMTDSNKNKKSVSLKVAHRKTHRSIAIECNLGNLPPLKDLLFSPEKKISKNSGTMLISTDEPKVQSVQSRVNEQLFHQVTELPAPQLYPITVSQNEHIATFFSTSSDSENHNGTCAKPPESSYHCNIKEEEFMAEQSQRCSNLVNENKFIVFESCLNQLLMSSLCKASPGCRAPIVSFQKYSVGSSILVIGTCLQQHRGKLWTSQPLVGKTPAGNLLISSAILGSGSNFLKIESFFNLINIFGISQSTHCYNQQSYLFPAINHHWQAQRQQLMEELRVEALGLALNGTFYSPSHLPKYCAYTVFDHKSNKIIDFQVQEGMGAMALENKTLQIVLDRMLKEGQNIYLMCTDFHSSIHKLLAEKYPFIEHLFDIWSLATSIGRKMMTASRRSQCAKLAKWISAATNHLWWSASTCQSDPKLLVEKWSSIVYHVSNQHAWSEGNLYLKCQHGDLNGKEEWLEPGSKAHTVFKRIVLNKKLLKDLKRLTFFIYTNELEGFHRTISKYTSKSSFYSTDGMVAQMQLAALDHNYNVTHKQVESSPGSSSGHKFVLCKGKRNRVVENIYEPTRQDFMKGIMIDVIDAALGNHHFSWNSN